MIPDGQVAIGHQQTFDTKNLKGDADQGDDRNIGRQKKKQTRHG